MKLKDVLLKLEKTKHTCFVYEELISYLDKIQVGDVDVVTDTEEEFSDAVFDDVRAALGKLLAEQKKSASAIANLEVSDAPRRKSRSRARAKSSGKEASP